MSELVLIARLHGPQPLDALACGRNEAIYSDYTTVIARQFYRANRKKLPFWRLRELHNHSKDCALEIWVGLLREARLKMTLVDDQESDFLALPREDFEHAWVRYLQFGRELNKWLGPCGYKFSATYEGRIPKDINDILNSTRLDREHIELIENPEAKMLARSLYL